MTDYVQCHLERKTVKQTSWIPKEFATVGGFVELKEKAGWEQGWKVIEAFHYAVRSHTEVLERSRDFKNTRKASDI